MDSVILRKLKHSDLDGVVKLIIAASLPYWQEKDLTKEVIAGLISKYNKTHLMNKVNGNPFYLAEDTSNSKIVGVIGLRKNEDSEIKNRVSTFFILPDYQGKGIGRALFEEVEKEAVKRNIKKLYVNSSPKAEDIYKHFGFKVSRREWKEYSNGTSDYNVWMEYAL